MTSGDEIEIESAMIEINRFVPRPGPSVRQGRGGAGRRLVLSKLGPMGRGLLVTALRYPSQVRNTIDYLATCSSYRG
jgi:hypothetical protein